MTFEIGWDFPARAALERIPWPTSGTIAGEVHRFVATLAPSLPSGPYHFRKAGYLIAVRLDQSLGTVLVLGVYRVR